MKETTIPAITAEAETEKTDRELSGELFLLSTIFFVFSALLLRFLVNLQIAVFLRHFHISFTYSLFHIDFSYISGAKWSLFKIIAVYGTAPILAFLGGIILLSIKIKSWKARLVQSWLILLMVLMLPFNILSGLVIPEGFGLVLNWLSLDIIYKILVTVVSIMIIALSRPFWVITFLRTAYSAKFLEDGPSRENYIWSCLIRPWGMGALILFAFALPHHDWVWTIFFGGIGLIILPLFSRHVPIIPLLIYKNDDRNILSRVFSVKYAGIALLILWLASWIRIPL